MIRPELQADERIPRACEQVPVDLSEVGKLAKIVTDSSAVIYCAGTVRGRTAVDFETANINGVKALIDALEQSGGTTPVLLLSSLAASRPQLSDYARSKHSGEQLLKDRPLLSWTILRPPAVYGPGDREMLPILKLARRGYLVHAGPGDQRLSLLHVDDLATACAAWLLQPQQCLHKTYAIDDGTLGGYDWAGIGDALCEKEVRVVRLPTVLLDLAARANLLFSSVLGYAPMLTPGKVRELVQADWLCDNGSFTQATGWKPALNLRQGAKQLFASKSKAPSS
jgi:nucleoside-diphosphate-sugar epimerase